MSDKDFIDVELTIPKELERALKKLNKQELLNRGINLALETKTYELRLQTALEDVDRLERENKRLERRTDIAETYIKQAQDTIRTLTDSWDDYND